MIFYVCPDRHDGHLTKVTKEPENCGCGMELVPLLPTTTANAEEIEHWRTHGWYNGEADWIFMKFMPADAVM